MGEELEIRVLGRVDALVDGQALPLGGSKQRAILAMLALRANRTVSVDDLIDGLWGDRPPASAAKNLSLYISRLRKALGADDSGATIVTQTSTNIRPDEGHIHLLVDNVVVSMNYGLEQDIPVHPGTYVLKAEFVAADHAPFSPRVFSSEVFFTVK